MSETPHPHAVFWIDVAKIATNPYQPRKYFDEARLQDLSDSIRRYGVLQPIVVTRNEEFTPEGGMVATYELIAGERRLRASKMAGLEKIPAIIREDESTDEEKLELAILENLQREDLNPVDRARSFGRLIDEFGLTHAEVGERLGKSREYVSNSMRLLALPDHILNALSQGRISEGHTRPLLMLKERPEEQETLFMQLINTAGGMTVRDAETFARGIAKEKQRVNKDLDPEMKEIQQKLSSRLGTKVSIDRSAQGGKVTIEFGNREDLRLLLEKIQREEQSRQEEALHVLGSATPLQSVRTTQDDTFEEDDQGSYSFSKIASQKQHKDHNNAVHVAEPASEAAQVDHDEIVFSQQTPEVSEERASGQDPLSSIQDELNKIAADFRGDSSEQEHQEQTQERPLEQKQDQTMAQQSTQVASDIGPVTPEVSKFAFSHDPLGAFGEPAGVQRDSSLGGAVLNTEQPQYNPQQSVQPTETEQGSQAVMNDAYIGSEFTPRQQQQISEAQSVEMGDDFIPQNQKPHQQNQTPESNEDNKPFDLSRFTI